MCLTWKWFGASIDQINCFLIYIAANYLMTLVSKLHSKWQTNFSKCNYCNFHRLIVTF